MVNFVPGRSVKIGRKTADKEEKFESRFDRVIKEKDPAEIAANANSLIKIAMVISIIIMLIVSVFILSQGHIIHIPPGDQKAEEYYDPQLVLKDAEIAPATTEKNYQLVDFDPCKNYKPQLEQAGFDLSRLFMGFPEPNKQRVPLHSPVPGNPGTYAKEDLACSWMIKDLNTPYYSFITLQEESYNKIPHSSERRVILNKINGPDNPPKPGFAAVYKIARYEIKGYIAFIKSQYDENMHKRECTLSFWPYLDIGATGPNCDKVKKFVSLILP